MSQEKFEEIMRQYLYHQPFLPFEVEMQDGRSVIVDTEFAMNAGMVAFISKEDQLIDFVCDEVKAIRPLTPNFAQ